jgi:hypothetical protein
MLSWQTTNQKEDGTIKISSVWLDTLVWAWEVKHSRISMYVDLTLVVKTKLTAKGGYTSVSHSTEIPAYALYIRLAK